MQTRRQQLDEEHARRRAEAAGNLEALAHLDAQYVALVAEIEQPARELDRLIADRVMGDRREGHTWSSADGSTFATVDGGPRRYSTDIEAAWRLLDRLRGAGWALYSLHDVTMDGTSWVCKLWQCEYGQFLYTPGVGGSAPEAICRAALRAAGVDFE